MSARVLIATTQNWPFAAQLAGAFAGAGAAVEALSPPGSMLALSRHPQRKHAYRALAPLSSLCDATAQNRFDMILPCDDQAADLVLRATGGVVIGRHTFLAGAREGGRARGGNPWRWTMTMRWMMRWPASACRW